MDSTTLYIVIATIGEVLLPLSLLIFFIVGLRDYHQNNETIEKVGGHIRRGANTFLKESIWFLQFSGIVAVLILLFYQNLFG